MNDFSLSSLRSLHRFLGEKSRRSIFALLTRPPMRTCSCSCFSLSGFIAWKKSSHATRISGNLRLRNDSIVIVSYLPEKPGLEMVKIAFLHPDLGIGGAERLVVDAALALKSKKHDVRLFTAHHDPKHCFSETRDGQLDVTCVGDWLPRRIADRCYALCAFIRMMFVALYAISAGRFDVFVCDQVSACIPLLRLFSPSSKVLFYCHFPDKLLAKRDTSLKVRRRGH